MLVSRQLIHCCHTTPVEVLVRVFASQAISSLAVEESTLPQYLEHGESGLTKMDAASGADTTAATARRAAVIRIVEVVVPFLQDVGMLYGTWE